MRILVTGGSGEVGQAVVDQLVKQKYSVRVIGRKQNMQFNGAEYQSCDINDYLHLRDVIRGCDAVVHLAGIPNPAAGTPPEVFRVNCQGTYNIFQAAAEEGITRVVQASSINAVGQFYGVKPTTLCYLPLDEDHPLVSTDPYSFSKHIIEEIGDYFWRREGITSLALRLPYVAPVSFRETAKKNSLRIQALVDNLLNRSVEERLSWFQAAWDGYNSFRSGRPYEIPGYARKAINEIPDEKRSMYATMMNRVNFFTYVDERDSAQAFEKGITAGFTGSHVLFINDKVNWTGVESRLLAELFYPDVKVFKKELKGNDTLVSIDSARRLIGYEPDYSFGN